MTPRTALSPAWLGLFAVATFGGLVVASFASGYHLVVKAAPQVIPAVTVEPPPSAAEPPPSPAAESQPTDPAASDPAEAIVRQNLTPDRALVRSQAQAGSSIVARLPSNQRVALRGRKGQWLRIEYTRNGKRVVGWTPESNLILR